MSLKQYYSTVMELSHGIVASLDETGNILQGNARLAWLVGLKEETIRGQNWANLCFSDNERTAAKVGLKASRSLPGISRIEGTLTTANGNKLFIEWKLKELLDSNGNFSAIICVGQDVTEHLALEKALLKERAGLIERNKELTCLYAISQLVTDMEREQDDILADIVGLIPPAFQFPDHTSARLEVDKTTFEAGVTVESEHQLSMPILVHGEPRGRLTVTYDGAFTASEPDAGFQPEDIFLEEEYDLTDAICKQVGLIVAKKEALRSQETLERQLRHADRLAKIGQFAAGVAHELNEPLATILGFAQLAGKTPDLPEQVGKDLDNIVKSSLHAREVIRKLMFFSRQVPPQTIRTDLNEIVSETLYFTEPSANRNDVTLEINLAENLPYVMADPQHLKQVIVNLAANAIHAMKDGGTLTFETSAFKDDVYLIVTDTGPGMAPDVLKQIFTPFFTTKDVNEGTGLGLSVVHGIIKAHGGVIEAASTEGQGTRFEIAFPCATSRLKAQ